MGRLLPQLLSKLDGGHTGHHPCADFVYRRPVVVGLSLQELEKYTSATIPDSTLFEGSEQYTRALECVDPGMGVLAVCPSTGNGFGIFEPQF